MTTEPATVDATLRQFIADNFLVDFGEEVTPETNLFRTGVIDSQGYVELVLFLEETYGIKITDDELIGEALSSLDKMVALVQQKLSDG